jgi:4-phytase/acid phosphatase
LHAFVALAALAAAGVAAVDTPPLQVAYVVVISRHGVRAPTWTKERLNEYSADPWPDWGVPPGNLTPHGHELMRLMGAYYRALLSHDGLLSREGCAEAAGISVWADVDQRTRESARALADGIGPDCGIVVHAQEGDGADPLFDPFGAGVATVDPERAVSDVRRQIGSAPERLVDAHREAFRVLDRILVGDRRAALSFIDETAVTVSATGKGVELAGPFAVGSTMSENLLLEYANNFQGRDLGWGRLDRETLLQVLRLHTTYADLVRRTPYIARRRGSNLLAHVLRSMQQAVDGTARQGALGRPGDILLVLSGHDTNLSNLSGMLDLSWHLPSYPPDDTPPGGAIVLSVWRDRQTKHHVVRAQYLAQSVDQMRDAAPLTLASPPQHEDLALPGCAPNTRAAGCEWSIVERALERAIDPTATSLRD